MKYFAFVLLLFVLPAYAAGGDAVYLNDVAQDVESDNTPPPGTEQPPALGLPQESQDDAVRVEDGEDYLDRSDLPADSEPDIYVPLDE